MSKRDVGRARQGAGALAELWKRLSSGDWQALFDEVERTLHEPVLDGRTPIEALRSGELERVLAAGRAAVASHATA